MLATRAYHTRLRLAPAAFAAVLLGLLAVPVLAQEQNAAQNPHATSATAQAHMAKAAPILVIYREDVKPGRVQSHDDLETNFAITYAKVPGARPFLAMNSISGPNQSWFMQPYGSLEEVQKESQATDNAPPTLKANLRRITSGEIDQLSGQVAITTAYRDDLSYNVDLSKLPTSRYVEVMTFRIKPGHENEFVESTNLMRAAHQKANVPMSWITYQVIAGAPSGTFYVFRLLDSLSQADPTNREMMQTLHQAMGDEGHKRLADLMSSCVLMQENDFYAFNPKTSFAPPEFAAADSFWMRPTQVAAQVGTSGKTKAPAASKTADRKKKERR